MAQPSIRDILIKRGEEILSQPFRPIVFARHQEADALLNDLDRYPHAFVLACIMDRQIIAEKAWMIPYEFKERLGSFEFTNLQALSLERVQRIMSNPKPLHRFPIVMSKNFFSAVQKIARVYSGKASNIWAGCPDSVTIVNRFREFDGVGPKIGPMAANILVRDFKIPIGNKNSIDISPDVHVRRVFTRLGLIVEGASNEELIFRARELNPTYPGVFDLPAWEIGREWCKPNKPNCPKCYMNGCCPTARITKGGKTGRNA